jgi:hypothetical protein
MFRPAPILTALVLVLVAGLAHGLVTARWHQSEDLTQALARVPQVPLTIGNWHGRNLEADPEPFAQARAEAYWVRRYEDTNSKAVVTVILMCGRAGPLSVHTPDVCYRGAGFEMRGSADRVDVPLAGAAAAQFWTARFGKDRPGAGNNLRLFWSWSAEGTWLAPSAPRLTFAGRSALFKLYVIREIGSEEEPAASDPARRFLAELLPALERSLFRASTEPGAPGKPGA